MDHLPRQVGCEGVIYPVKLGVRVSSTPSSWVWGVIYPSHWVWGVIYPSSWVWGVIYPVKLGVGVLSTPSSWVWGCHLPRQVGCGVSYTPLSVLKGISNGPHWLTERHCDPECNSITYRLVNNNIHKRRVTILIFHLVIFSNIHVFAMK